VPSWSTTPWLEPSNNARNFASDSRKASIQKILEAPLQIRNFYGGSVLTQSYKLRIFDLDSHPVMQKLGLEFEQSTSLGVWLKVDFILGLGTEF